jgi:hypothetical protein
MLSSYTTAANVIKFSQICNSLTPFSANFANFETKIADFASRRGKRERNYYLIIV